MFILARAATYSALFIGLLLIFLPTQIFSGAFVRPAAMGPWQAAGILMGIIGAALAFACIGTLVFVGKGTPAPFDPPRRLVIRGPYRLLRNPMYLGATMALAGAALFYRSLGLLAYAAAFVVVSHLFVVFYEEPTLRQSFGEDYASYCRRTSRWMPICRAAE
jgi:protein-S-isoprenylcysteine O-methyltransferase Ste14